MTVAVAIHLEGDGSVPDRYVCPDCEPLIKHFQKDRDTGDPKGIIAIDLVRWQP